MTDRTVRVTQGWAGRTVVLAVAFGLLAGLAELVLLAVKKYGQGRIIHVSRDALWMIPLADIVLCLCAALLLLVLAWRLPSLRGPRTAVAFTAFPAMLTILLHYRPLHIAAKVILALGIAVQAGVVLARWPQVARALFAPFTGRFIRRRRTLASAAVAGSGAAGVAGLDVDRRRFLAGAASLLGGLAVGTRGWLRLAEYRARPQVETVDGVNVLLIVLDTVRAQSLSVYGYDRATTPALEILAAAGTVFERAYATAPWTLPSHASMFTGRWHHELSADWDDPLDPADPTLAEVLGAAGWATAGFVANTAYASYEHGLDRGFARYEDYRMTPGQVLGSSALGATIGCGNRNEAGCRLRGPLGLYELLGRKPADHVRERFTHWLDGIDAGRPFFAFLNLFDAHAPYLPPAPFDTAFAQPLPRENPMHFDRPGWEWTEPRVRAEQNAYDGAIAYIDQQLGLLFNELDRRGRLANTLVIVTSDHGEEFMEHGVMTHANSLYSPALHVPLLLALPGRVPEGARIQAPVSIRDLPATICDLLGVRASFPGESIARFWQDGRAGTAAAPADASRPTAGRAAAQAGASDTSSAPAGSARTNARNAPIHADLSGRTFRPSHYPVSRGDMQSVIDGRWHYIRRGDGHEELYDLAADPWERTDRLAAERTLADSLARMLPRRGAPTSGGGQP